MVRVSCIVAPEKQVPPSGTLHVGERMVRKPVGMRTGGPDTRDLVPYMSADPVGTPLVGRLPVKAHGVKCHVPRKRMSGRSSAWAVICHLSSIDGLAHPSIWRSPVEATV